MSRLVDRAKARIGQIKADRSTEMGIAGHKAAMAALGKATGWESFGLAVRHAVKTDGGNYYANRPSFAPGKGHVLSQHSEGGEGLIEKNVIDRHKPTEDF